MAVRIRCVIPNCTCFMRLGRLQFEFETLLGQGGTPYAILTELGLVKMCCLNNMLSPPSHVLCDANAGCIIDEVGVITRAIGSRSKNIIEDGPSLYMEDVPPFPAAD